MEELDLAILNLLIFPETFESIVYECPIPTTKHIAGDVLKKLMHDELVMPMFKDELGNIQRSLGYDSDALNQYLFQSTAKGLLAIEKFK